MKDKVSVMKTGGALLLLAGLFVCVCLAWIPGRMTGGGSVFTSVGTEVQVGDRVTHGFEIHCGSEDGNIPLPNNLEINWSGNRFHLDYLTFASCTDDPTITPNPPYAPFDTFEGFGKGSYNGQPGASIHFKFTDAGERGTEDTAEITIWSGDYSSSPIVLQVDRAFLTFGNHQAHKD
jgi:hypothetical protein